VNKTLRAYRQNTGAQAAPLHTRVDFAIMHAAIYGRGEPIDATTESYIGSMNGCARASQEAAVQQTDTNARWLSPGFQTEPTNSSSNR